MTALTKNLALWVVVIAALFALLLTLTLPSRADATTFLNHVAVWVAVIAALYALVIVLMLRGLRKMARGDLSAIDDLFVRSYGWVQDRHWPHIVEARSESLDSVLHVIYPWTARAAKLDGHAQARFDLGDDGLLRNIEIVEASHPLFAKALLESLSRARGARRVLPSDDPGEIRINFAIAS